MRIIKISRVKTLSNTIYLDIVFGKSFGRTVTKTCIAPSTKNGHGVKFYDTGEFIPTKMWDVVASFIESNELTFSPK